MADLVMAVPWGAGRYLESLPVGPNHSDSMLTSGLFLQSPQLPACLGAVPEGCDGGHCLFTSLLIFQLSQEFPRLVEIEHANISVFFHDFLPHSILKSMNSQEGAHLPSSGVGLDHSGGALDLLVFLLLL